MASFLAGELLDAARTRLEWQEIIVAPLRASGQSQFIAAYLGRYRKQLTAKQTKAIQALRSLAVRSFC